MHRTQDCEDASVTVCGRGADRQRAASGPGRRGQMNPPLGRPQAQTPSFQTPSPSASISDEKLNAAAAVLGQVATIRQSYESEIAAAPPSDKQRLAKERI